MLVEDEMDNIMARVYVYLDRSDVSMRKGFRGKV